MNVLMLLCGRAPWYSLQVGDSRIVCCPALDLLLRNLKFLLSLRVRVSESSFSRILLAGDSAGGNFVLGVLQLAVKHGLPMPEGAILMYPATLLRDMISPARLMSFFDPMVGVILPHCGED